MNGSMLKLMALSNIQNSSIGKMVMVMIVEIIGLKEMHMSL